MKNVYLVGTRWFGILGPCQLLINELAKRNCNIFVIGAKDAKYKQFETSNCTLVDVNFKRSYFSLWSDLRDLFKIIKLAKIYPPSYIHSFNPKPSFFALLLNKLFKCKLFIGVTGLGNTFIKKNITTSIFRKLISYTYNSADYLFFQNNDDVSFFKKIIKDHSKIKMFISPGVDIERFKYTERSIRSTLKVIFVGRLLWQKGVDDYIDAANKYLSTYPLSNIEFSLIGPADHEHPDRLREEDIKKLKKSKIRWIEWVDKIENEYYSHDVLIFMSHREGGPRAILEASSTGMPTIGANSIGVKELVIDGETGFLIDLHNIDAIVDKIHYYYLNREKIIIHGRNARRFIAEPLSLENATEAQLKMYQA